MSLTPRTLYDKLWDEHVVHQEADGTALIYIDRHLLHEVTSPQAFEGLRNAGRDPWRVSANLAVVDHNVPTTDRSAGIADPISRLQVETLDDNARKYGLTYFNIADQRQGIVHIIGPEQGATLLAYAFADVAYAKQGPGPLRPIERSLICLNPLKSWKLGFDGNLAVYDIRYTIAHEIGHAIGLDHPEPHGQLMSRRYQEEFRAPQAGDVSGAVRIYGPRRGQIRSAGAVQ